MAETRENTPLPDIAECQQAMLVGYSMHPLVRPRDLIYYQPVSLDEVQVGDVLVFLAPERRISLLVHRCVAKKPEGLVTKGDNSALSDKGILQAPLLQGRVVWVQRGERYLYMQSALAKLSGRVIAAVSRVEHWLWKEGIWRPFIGLVEKQRRAKALKKLVRLLLFPKKVLSYIVIMGLIYYRR